MHLRWEKESPCYR